MNMTIGQVARKTGLGIETIRFYERKGLIDEPARKESGYRQYNIDVVSRLVFIQQAKMLGFSLAEINELLSLKLKADGSSREIKKIAEKKLADIEDRIRKLKRIQNTLRKLVNECPGQGTVDSCPILEAFASAKITSKKNKT